VRVVSNANVSLSVALSFRFIQRREQISDEY